MASDTPGLIVKKLDTSTIASYVFVAGFLLLVLIKGLLGALFAGLLVYSLIHLMAPLIGRKFSDARSRTIAAAVIGLALIVTMGLAAWGVSVLLKGDASSMSHMFQKMADII